MSPGKKYFFDFFPIFLIDEKNREKAFFFKGRQLRALGDNTVVGGHHYQDLHRHILRELLRSTQASLSPRLCSLM